MMKEGGKRKAKHGRGGSTSGVEGDGSTYPEQELSLAFFLGTTHLVFGQLSRIAV